MREVERPLLQFLGTLLFISIVFFGHEITISCSDDLLLITIIRF